MASLNVYPETIKVSFAPTNEIRRIAHGDKSATFSQLKQTLAEFWGDHTFVLAYNDEDGDKVTVSSEADWAEALCVAEAVQCRVFKLQAHPGTSARRQACLLAQQQGQGAPSSSNRALLLAPPARIAPASNSASKTACPPFLSSSSTSLAVHPGITCDKSGMSPIVGPRFHVLGNDYDVCQAEFDKLPETERLLFVKIDRPGHSPVPCLPPREGGVASLDKAAAKVAQSAAAAAAAVDDHVDELSTAGATAGAHAQHGPELESVEALPKPTATAAAQIFEEVGPAGSSRPPRTKRLQVTQAACSMESSYVSVEPTTAEEEAAEEVVEEEVEDPTSSELTALSSPATFKTANAEATAAASEAESSGGDIRERDGDNGIGREGGGDPAASLADLAAMGFADDAHSRALLALYNGRADLVIDALLEGF